MSLEKGKIRPADYESTKFKILEFYISVDKFMKSFTIRLESVDGLTATVWIFV